MINPFELKKGTLEEQVQFLNGNYYLEDAILYKELHEKIYKANIELDLLRQILYAEVNLRRSKRALLSMHNNCGGSIERNIIDKFNISVMLKSCGVNEIYILEDRIESHQLLRKECRKRIRYYKEKLDALVTSFVEGQSKAKTLRRFNNMTADLIKRGLNPEDDTKWYELSLECNMRKFK